MKAQGFGAGYAYDHDAPEAFSGQNYFPDTINREQYYQPNERGFERELIRRVEYFARLRAKRNNVSPE
jgi:putative ATPase